MTRLQIDLPDDVQRLANEEVASGRFPSLSKYLTALIRKDHSRPTEREVSRLLLQRLQSGSSREMFDSDFDAIRTRLEKEIERRRGTISSPALTSRRPVAKDEPDVV